MPLKPIFDKAPLMKMTAMPLRPGQVRTAVPQAQTLYRQTGVAQSQPALWEGVFRLACTTTARPMQEPVAAWIQQALAAQEESGALPGSIANAVAVLRAAWAMVEYDPQRPLLEKIALWCGWACEHWEEVLADTEVRQKPADLMELLCNLYRVTGKKAVLSLCEKLRAQGMDWSGALHVFAAQRPMKRIVSHEELVKGMEKEACSESGYYTRQYLTCHAETLADGMRAATATGRYSGSGTELSAAKTGWERISRYHGAACGGVTADETLAGASPCAAISAAAVGAWAEALANVGEGWAMEELDVLAHNALEAAVRENGVADFQRVNALAQSCGTKDCYHVGEDAALRGLNRLCRGYAAVASGAVMQTAEGAQVNLYLPGRYAVINEKGTLLLDVNTAENEYALTVHVKEALRMALRLRIPAWMKEATVFVNGLELQEDCEMDGMHLERVWQDGDVITVKFTRVLSVKEGYHQSAWVMLGNQLMAMPVAALTPWNVAMYGAPELTEEGKVSLPVRVTPDWKRSGDVPADLPVLPATQGEVMQVTLMPYARCSARIAQFPRGKQA